MCKQTVRILMGLSTANVDQATSATLSKFVSLAMTFFNMLPYVFMQYTSRSLSNIIYLGEVYGMGQGQRKRTFGAE